MRAGELYEEENEKQDNIKDNQRSGHYDPSSDEYGMAELGDTRRPTLTLRHLNKLKKMRASRKLDMLRNRDLLKVMYGMSSEEEGGGLDL